MFNTIYIYNIIYKCYNKKMEKYKHGDTISDYAIFRQDCYSSKIAEAKLKIGHEVIFVHNSRVHRLKYKGFTKCFAGFSETCMSCNGKKMFEGLSESICLYLNTMSNIYKIIPKFLFTDKDFLI